MGWTSQHRDKGTTNVDFFGERLGARRRIIEHATVHGVFYAAVKELDTGEVWAYVALTQWTRDYFNFTYKDLEESMGIGDGEAPLKVLAALTPTDNETSLAWRTSCRDAAERKARSAQALKGLRDGDVVTLSTKLRFANGTEQDTFVVQRRRTSSARTQVVLTADGQGYRVPRWRERVASVVRGGERIDLVGGRAA